MHVETIEINVFDKGDYVRTSRGVGVVIDVKSNNYEDIKLHEVMVKHKYSDEDNPENIAQIMRNDVPTLITKEEYDNE